MPIFDQGYQHWSGKLSGHTWRWLTITRHGIRAASKNRVVRTALIVAWIPAIVLVAVLSLWGMVEQKSSTVGAVVQSLSLFFPGVTTDPLRYRVDVWRLSYSYFLRVELFCSMLLILLVGPSLISQDLRFNALPLYFSRPLRRIDYFFGKLGTIVAFLGLVMIVPSVVAYIFGLLFSLDITIIRDTFGILLASVVYGLIISVSAGLLILAMSALSRNSRYVALTWVGIWFVSGIVSTVLLNVDSQQRRYSYYKQVIPPPDYRSDMTRQERSLQVRQWRDAREKAGIAYQLAELEYSKTDWRPLVSYVANLSRLGQQLLHTNDTWKDLSQFQTDPTARDKLLATYMGPQYPWYWSALVLLGLGGLSACILNLSIKSLDRLK
jgi:ABC-2 type transport system permease protein